LNIFDAVVTKKALQDISSLGSVDGCSTRTTTSGQWTRAMSFGSPRFVLWRL